jgi:hypothetical protein
MLLTCNLAYTFPDIFSFLPPPPPPPPSLPPSLPSPSLILHTSFILTSPPLPPHPFRTPLILHPPSPPPPPLPLPPIS